MHPEDYFWGGGLALQTSVCAIAVYFWDLAVTFPLERRLIWKTRFARENLLYFWSRFYGLAGLLIYLSIPQGTITSATCMKRHSVRYALIQLGMSITQLWTLKQTLFLYSQSRRALAVIGVTVSISAVLQSYGMVLYFRHLGYSSDCQRVSDRPVGIIIWTVGTVSIQAVVFATSLFRWVNGQREGIISASDFLDNIVARDNVATSLFILTVYTSATIIRSRFGVGENIWNFAWAWVFAFLNIATYRTVLNYREALLIIQLGYRHSFPSSDTLETFTYPASPASSVRSSNASETSSTLGSTMSAK